MVGEQVLSESCSSETNHLIHCKFHGIHFTAEVNETWDLPKVSSWKTRWDVTPSLCTPSSQPLAAYAQQFKRDFECLRFSSRSGTMEPTSPIIFLLRRESPCQAVTWLEESHGWTCFHTNQTNLSRYDSFENNEYDQDFHIIIRRPLWVACET